MPQRKRSRTRYSPKRRAEIIAVADKEGLTATDVQKRFGVIPVTYYSWRKKVAGRRGSGASQSRNSRGGGGRSEGRIRVAVRAQLDRQLPRIVEEEIGRYLAEMFGSGPRRKHRG